MRRSRMLALIGAIAGLLAACGNEAPPSSAAASPRESIRVRGEALALAPSTQPAKSSLDELFDKASAEFNVPAELLEAISYTETRFQMVVGGEEIPGLPAAYGLMALRGDALTRGAALAGVSEDQVRYDAFSNIRAAAAILSAGADEAGIDRRDLGAWAPLVAKASGIPDANGQASYVHNDVYAVLNQGVVVQDASGPVASVMPRAVQPAFPAPDYTLQSADYAPAVWRPSPNYNSRPTGSIGTIGMIVIHDCEGSYSSCWSWLTNSAAQASAHYVVKEDGTEISQLVLEANRAWHVAATYDCSLNSSVDCWRNGYSVNHFSVGIEHGGFASQTSWPTSQIDASARLSCDIARDRSIPRDRYHIVGHGQLQPSDRTDPGPNWPWTDYLNRVNNYCSGGALIIDSNNSNNDTSKGYIEVSANWVSSANVGGYYGSGYWYASTAAVSDPATFWFYMPAAGTKTIDAWWTAATDRSTTAPWVIFDANGTKLATVNVNQQVNGGQWNVLGTWSFPAGWNKVVLSRWTTTGYVVIADAVRIR